MKPEMARRLLLRKHLGDTLRQIVRRENVRFIWVVSARIGEGKTLYVEMVREYLQQRYPDQYVFLSQKNLFDRLPDEFATNQVIIIDGSALTQGEGSLSLPPVWQESIETAVVTVMGRRTTSAELDECLSRLKSMDIRPLGVVFNDVHNPWTSRRYKRVQRIAGKPEKNKRKKPTWQDIASQSESTNKSKWNGKMLNQPKEVFLLKNQTSKSRS